MMRQRIARAVQSVAGGLARSTAFALCALIIPAGIALLPVLAAFHLLGGGPWSWSNPWSWIALALIAAPVTLVLAHPVARLFRRLLARWSRIDLPDGYRQQPEPVRLSTGFWWNGASYEKSLEDAQVDLRMRRIREPAYWREVRWAAVAAVVVAPACVAPLTALASAVLLFVEASWASTVSGMIFLVIVVVIAPLAWRIVRPLAERFLAAPSATASQATDLRRQRADLTASHDAEIRRIERDLHDGAQSRLVAVGLDLAAAERLWESDPERAKELLRVARAGTGESLKVLRELVHGVYPSVLIERGLVPAIRALALDSPIETVVDGPEEFRIASPLEAAIYFSVSELHTNIVHHAHASRARITVTARPTCVDVIVRDDGRGEATARPGGGLVGVRRRLAAFDGTLQIDSPSGGPTIITVRVPCESS